MLLISEKIADFVLTTALDNIEKQVQEKAKECLIDCLGCMLAGSREPVANAVMHYSHIMGGKAMCAVIGRSFKTSPYQAALVNGVSTHALDYDDVSINLTGHPSVTILPAVLAAGAVMHISGKQALEAFIIGVEVVCAIGKILNPMHYSKGWHSTSTLGIFGATVAAGKILGLNRVQLVNAIGIATSEAAGVRKNFGTMTKPLHAGLASANGLQAAYLASMGVDASPDAFEGFSGFVQTTTGQIDLTSIADMLGNPFEFESPGITLKPYASCKGTHNGIDAMLKLSEQYNLYPEDIEKIDCGVLPIAKDILIYNEPQTGAQGKFSMNFCLALAMINRTISMNDFTDENVKSPLYLKMMEKINLYVDSELGNSGYFQGSWDTIVTVTTKLGKKYSCRVNQSKGEPGNPLSKEEILDKYRECGKKVLTQEQIEKSIILLQGIEELQDVQVLIANLQSDN